MNNMRKLMETVEKIDESYHSQLAAALEDLVANNPNLSADKLVAIARSKYGQEAATYLSDKLEAEADLADYEASDPQPHMREDSDMPEADADVFDVGAVTVRISGGEVTLQHGHGENIFLTMSEWEEFCQEIDGFLRG